MKYNFQVWVQWTFLSLIIHSFNPVMAQSFFSEDFGKEDALPFGWISNDNSDNGIFFQKGSNVDLASGYSFLSATADNGFALCISARPTPYSVPHESTLSSSTIDCSPYDEEVFLTFNSLIITYELRADTNAYVIVDNGLYNQKYMLYEHLSGEGGNLQFSRNPENHIIDISEVAAGSNRVKITWYWQGLNENYFCIDDVALYDYNPFYRDVVWGQEPGQGDFKQGLNQWTTNSNQTIPYYWKWVDKGNVANALSIGDDDPFPYIQSYSFKNGAAVFNADFYTTGGSEQVSVYPFYQSDLISPIINLRDIQTDLVLEFTQFTMLLNECSGCALPRTSVSYSVDGGVSWSVPIAVNDNLEPNKKRNSTVKIPLAGVAGKSRFRLKFTFAGDLYFWVIDDVILRKRLNSDLEVMNNYFAIAPNAMTPKSQVESVGFMGDIRNRGLETQYNVKYTVKINRDLEDEVLFTDTILVDSIAKDQLLEENIFERYFLPDKKLEAYNVSYEVSSALTDEDPQNNKVDFKFYIVDSIYAKETGANAKIVPESNNNSFTYANCFYVPNGYAYRADKITFGIGNANQLQGKEILVSLYGFIGDIDDNDFADEQEITLLATNAYTIQGDEGILNEGLITIPVSDLPNDSLTRLDRFPYYIVSISYQTFDNIPCQVLASTAYNYQAMYFRSKAVGLPRYAGLIRDNQYARFDLQGFNLTQVPVIRMHLKTDPNYVSTNNVHANSPISVYPNPTKDFANIELPSGLSATNIQVSLIDIIGNKHTLSWNEVNSKRIQIDLAMFSKGLYMLLIDAGNKRYATKILLNK